MALSPTEESLVRQLIAQNPALLNLASSESTIISKLGATKVSLSDLSAATSLSDADLALVRQGLNDKSFALSILSDYVNGKLPDASTTAKGIVELATNTETQTGTDTVRAVTPAGLASVTATETRAGLIEIATTAEAQAMASDTHAMTPAKVREVLGNLSDFSAFSVNTTLDIGHCGGLYTPTIPGLTFTLPKCSAVPPGSVLTFYGNSQGVTIQRGSSGDAIVLGSTILIPSFALKEYDRVQLVNSGLYWYAVSGEASLGVSSSFASSLSGNGYQKLPSGLIIQWTEATTSESADVTFTFPIAFPNAVFKTYGAVNAPNGGNITSGAASTGLNSGIAFAYSAHLNTRAVVAVNIYAIGY